mmetsp:Transcript_3056/g.8298  ORF Transcript_3056/g.8298 Transcript_3056/m.8298 type:complete len:275 (+) Transcript_3056:48-872(+)
MLYIVYLFIVCLSVVVFQNCCSTLGSSTSYGQYSLSGPTPSSACSSATCRVTENTSSYHSALPIETRPQRFWMQSGLAEYTYLRPTESPTNPPAAVRSASPAHESHFFEALRSMICTCTRLSRIFRKWYPVAEIFTSSVAGPRRSMTGSCLGSRRLRLIAARNGGGLGSEVCCASLMPCTPTPLPPQTIRGAAVAAVVSSSDRISGKGWPITPAIGRPRYATPYRHVTHSRAPFAYSFVPSSGSMNTTTSSAGSATRSSGGHTASSASTALGCL